jgi:excisionase family DNA binding protein
VRIEQGPASAGFGDNSADDSRIGLQPGARFDDCCSCTSPTTRGDELDGELELLTVREVADTMRVSTMTVYRLIRSDALPAIRVGTHFRIRNRDLEGYLESQSTRGGDAWPAA